LPSVAPIFRAFGRINLGSHMGNFGPDPRVGSGPEKDTIMATNMLRDRLIQKEKRNGNYPDGRGMYLEVRRGGKSKNWSFRYAFDGDRDSTTLGSYPDVSLHKAREDREKYRGLVAAGIDPKVAREAEKARQARARAKGKPFRDFAEAWIVNQEKNNAWTPRVAKLNKRFFKNQIYPKSDAKHPHGLGLGDVSIQMLDFGHPDGGKDAVKLIAEALRWHWDHQPPTGERLRQLIHAALTWARDAEGVIVSPDAALLTRTGEGPLGTFLKSVESFHTIVHRPMLPYKKLPEFMVESYGAPRLETGATGTGIW
jgi:hypothetical protein